MTACKNCKHGFYIKNDKGIIDLNHSQILQCRRDPPQNIFTDRGVMIQPLVVDPNYYCGSFEIKEG